ncbi:hypothetical protein ASPACDRAFT_45783 [Aspergillus aculeatus ATCC 16872]|uniref:Uncharacterized protein n=1 Tax=Aspergillus aculeatus (strain ATCC 16872 / CBS 172.66 / WB 5094) TaxID=690307 RepID=A0A1L9WNF9_ASPA1|nr:uncharacterized protein ASPACDRAFT_45783 [Aspergillus aculeatus ATCC 16872]OJJ97686.1 hypothetical protein ASPACDRAFT_45783 [Aspergillus aculeatus ATCC 16872]
MLHCSTQLVAPAAADTYRTLLTNENFVQLFPTAVGCEGWVLRPILEAIFLATWKKDQEIQGQLSSRELIARVDRIESVLHLHGERLTPKVINHNNNNPSTSTSTNDTYIFAHASFVHLHTEVSGCKPSVPEIQQNTEEVHRSVAAAPAGRDQFPHNSVAILNTWVSRGGRSSARPSRPSWPRGLRPLQRRVIYTACGRWCRRVLDEFRSARGGAEGEWV